MVGLKIQSPDPDSLQILDETISKEPLGPAVKSDDQQFIKITEWTFYATILAEEYDITSMNIDGIKNHSDEIKQFLGVTHNMASTLELSNNFAYRIIKHIGNYGEIYDKNMGKYSKLKLERGKNSLWKHGGLHCSPPFSQT